jgi:hypothetical protein
MRNCAAGARGDRILCLSSGESRFATGTWDGGMTAQ